MVSKAISTPILALALAGLGACKGNGGDDPAIDSSTNPAGKTEGDGGSTPPGPDSGDSIRVRDPEPDDPRASAVTIARSEAASPIGGKGVSSLGFSLEKISHLFSLAATAKIPDWGAAGQSEARLTRDDDLDSAWQCKFGGAQPCVLGLALPEKAKVEAVRLYAAAGPRYRDYTGHPRIAKLRVHTEAGYVDVSLADGANHNYVRFDRPIETQYLALEVLATHGGKDDALVHIAEVEAYGTDGAPRQPIDLDPDFAWLSWETGAWGSGKGDHSIRQVFLEFARARPGEEPVSRRFLRASGVFGRPGDDYLLFERLHGTDCSKPRGSYVLFDRRNRMFYPLGELGGAGAEVYRHAGGRGFAVGWIGADEYTIKGVVEEAGELQWKRPPKQRRASGVALLREWGFETEPLPRAQAIDESIPGCRRAAQGDLAPLIVATKLDQASTADPSQWLVCSVGDDTLYASSTCGKPARAYQLSAGKLIGKHESKKVEGRGLRLRRVGDRLLVELSTADDSGALLWAEPGLLHDLGAGGLFVRPPAACSKCDDLWSNPTAPAPEALVDERDAFDEDEEYADEGDQGDEGDPEPAPSRVRPAPPPTPPLPG